MCETTILPTSAPKSLDMRGLRLCSLVLSLALPVAFAKAADPPKLEYNRDIRPILSEHCFACHGPDSAARKASLRLDRLKDAQELEAIVPGNPEASGLVERVNSTNVKEVMPPPATKKTLTAEQKAILTRWIAAGAEYQPHWSLIAPKKAEPPAVKNGEWVRNPIDRFVLASLEAKELQPAPEADRRTIARRLSLDLNGLPPTPEEVEAFVKDESPDAYERYVDHLLASPKWGEHRGRYWLDAARYADTHGIHFDNYREVWSYRDWVINAFNKNIPFDQFTIEQLAGDLLPNRTLEQQVASGFNRCNMTTNEGGVIAEEYLVMYTRDRTETTSQVFLGLTAGCAVCHDHKFDPISQREFYELSAFFNNTTQGAMDGNIKDTPPVLVVPSPEDRPRWEALTKDVELTKNEIEARREALKTEIAQSRLPLNPDEVAKSILNDGLKIHAGFNEGDGKTAQFTIDGKARPVELGPNASWIPGNLMGKAVEVKPDAVIEIADIGDFEKDQAFSYGAWVKLADSSSFGAIFSRMDESNGYRGWDLWVEGGKVGAHLVNKWPESGLKVLAKKPIKEGEWHHVFVTYEGKGKAIGLKVYIDGKVQETYVESNNLKGTIKTTVPFSLAKRSAGARLNHLGLADLRIYGRSLSANEVESLAENPMLVALASKPAGSLNANETADLADWWLIHRDEPYKAILAKQAAIEAERDAIKARGTVASVMQERPIMPEAFVLARGDYDKRKEAVKPSTPAALPPMAADLPRNRLGLAKWLLAPEQPLTTRVTVNRFWQELFGNGIARTTGDFGITGDTPSHPELLDWLAVDFRESGWDIKRFYKQVVMSATYRQSSRTTPEKLEKDRDNRLLSRGPRFRMDAEMVRDYALAASGMLSPKIGGPSVKPYQPEGVWEAVAMDVSNTRIYQPDHGESLYRRSMYTFWKRAAPPASMDIFNAPSREVCTVRRERTNTPLQALVTLNDPQFIEAARHLATLALKQGGDTNESKIDFIARRLVARPFSADEQTIVQGSLAELLGFYQGHASDAKEVIQVGESKADPAIDPALLAAWTMLTNELMNLDEVLNK